MGEYKILLVTLQGANIGNRLQNYALQKTLEKKNCIIYTPIYDIPEYDTIKKKTKTIIKIILGTLGIKKYVPLFVRVKREQRFRKFDKKYISNQFKVKFNAVSQMEWSSYDLAIAGSDQVWHKWSENQNELSFFYLQFIPENKRIAYAPSFGFDELPQADKDIHFSGIKSMKMLSAREDSGRKIMEQVSGKKVDLVLDPTLLLEKDEWIKIEKQPKYHIPEKYVLVYILGNKIQAYKDVIDSTADRYKANIIDIFDQTQLEYFLTTPDEFIWLVNHATYIMTDSFHACVFSIIFHKKFHVFRRQGKGYDKMFGRIETLLSICKIEYSQNDNVNWSAVDNNLKEERIMSLKYIEKALGQ